MSPGRDFRGKHQERAIDCDGLHSRDCTGLVLSFANCPRQPVCFFFGSITVFDLSAAACLGTDYEQPMTFLRSGGCLAELPLMVASLIVPQLVSFFPAQLDMSPCRRLPTSAGLWRRRTCARHLGGGLEHGSGRVRDVTFA